MPALYLNPMARLFMLSQSDIPPTTGTVYVGTKFAELFGEQRRLGGILV